MYIYQYRRKFYTAFLIKVSAMKICIKKNEI